MRSAEISSGRGSSGQSWGQGEAAKEERTDLVCRDLGIALESTSGRSSFRSVPLPCQGVKQIPCVCGYVVKGEDDEELWQRAQEHMREDHPDLAGKVSREDVLAQAEEVPRPKS